MHVIERGWLSANSIVFHDPAYTSVIDTGYCSHSEQTLSLLHAALRGRALNRIINTHLHSDHCGGNAALVAQYGCEVLIPCGEAAAVRAWDEDALSYRATGQLCPRFSYTGVIQHGSQLLLGGEHWQVLAAPGHDPASVVLYCPAQKQLISADALWENGFGVIFPELTGEPGFDDVASTLDMIASLNVGYVVPGHGSPFTDIKAALTRAYTRLNSFVQSPEKHRWHGVKVLIVYWLMDVRQASISATINHFSQTHYIQTIARMLAYSANDLITQAIDELAHKQNIRRQGDIIFTA